MGYSSYTIEEWGVWNPVSLLHGVEWLLVISGKWYGMSVCLTKQYTF